MSNFWLRLWHDMPNDPKWRTIARVSKQPLALVQATYIHILVDASRNVTRGHVTVTFEDLASALDCDASQIEDIYNAMQGRVLDGNELTGWALRQPKREDAGNPATGAKSAAQRKREQRERKKEALESESVTNVTDVTKNVTSHEMSRNGHDSVTDKRDINNDKQAKNSSQTLESKGVSRMSRNVTLDTDTDTDTDIRAKRSTQLKVVTQAVTLPVTAKNPESIDQRQKYAMHLDWQPDSKTLHAMCRKSGVDTESITNDMLIAFKLWHSGKQAHETNHGWHTSLVRWAIRERSMSSQPQANQSQAPNFHDDDGAWASDLGW